MKAWFTHTWQTLRSWGWPAATASDGLPLGSASWGYADRSRSPTGWVGFDQALLAVVAALLTWGLVMVYSASIAIAESDKALGYNSSYYLVRQTIFLIVSLTAGFIAFNVPMAWWQKMARKYSRLHSATRPHWCRFTEHPCIFKLARSATKTTQRLWSRKFLPIIRLSAKPAKFFLNQAFTACWWGRSPPLIKPTRPQSNSAPSFRFSLSSNKT